MNVGSLCGDESKLNNRELMCDSWEEARRVCKKQDVRMINAVVHAQARAPACCRAHSGKAAAAIRPI